jgi:signal transduction histidine kinase
MSQRPLYNSRIASTFVKLVEHQYPKVDLKRVLREADIEPYEVGDEGHWFTQQQMDLFVAALVRATGHPGIAREAGRYSASVQALGIIKKYLLGLIGPGNAFSSLEKTSSNLTRSASYQTRRISASQVEITVTPFDDVQESPFQCENRLGCFEAILATFDCSDQRITHPECMFHGDPVCRYQISWKESAQHQVLRGRNYLSGGLLLVSALLALLHSWQALGIGLTATLFSFVAATCMASRMENRELLAALDNLRESTDELLTQTGMNYQNALMVNEIGQAISKQAGIDEVLENVVRALENRLSYDRAAILLADPEQRRLSFRIGFGYSEQEIAVLREASFNLANPQSRGAFVTCYRERRAILINDFTEVAEVHSSRSQQIADKVGAQSFLCCPIVCEGESLGVLAVDNIKSKKELVQSDLSLLTGIAPVIGMSIRNARYLDLEEQRSAQMRQSQKMEAIGQLAGGIAHDFNNLLTAIIGFATLARMETDSEKPSAKFLDEVLVASERATHLTKGLLSFSRKQAIDLQPVDLNATVAHIEKLLRRLISEEIELVLACAPGVLPVVADPGQLDQIILNLATNARDAMEQRGVLTIETGQVEVGPRQIAGFAGLAPGSYARLVISDTGKGMDSSTAAHIFEPFFTTKEVGKGTGLGLSIVYGIVKQHGGFLEVDSSPGMGSSFLIYFPLLATEARPAPQPQPGCPSAAGNATVLVVEDAPEVRRLTREVLESQGYRVIEAVDGEDALAQFRAHLGEISLVVMDVVMPKLDGKETFAEMDRLRPGTKVLFTSGYTPDDVNRKGIRFDRDNFLAKPCSPQDLLRMVGELLG